MPNPNKNRRDGTHAAEARQKTLTKVSGVLAALPPPIPINLNRPTRYSVHEHTADILAAAAEGQSRAEIAAKIGITPQTWINWEKENAEFAALASHARALSQAWWEQAGRILMATGKNFSAQAFAFIVKNRFPSEYHDKVEIEHTHEAGDKLADLLGDIRQRVGMSGAESGSGDLPALPPVPPAGLGAVGAIRRQMDAEPVEVDAVYDDAPVLA